MVTQLPVEHLSRVQFPSSGRRKDIMLSIEVTEDIPKDAHIYKLMDNDYCVSACMITNEFIHKCSTQELINTILSHCDHNYKELAYSLLTKIAMENPKKSIENFIDIELALNDKEMASLTKMIGDFPMPEAPTSIELYAKYKKQKALLLKNQKNINKQVYLASNSKPAAVAQLPGINKQVKHPINESIMTIQSIIIDLNDHHGWTREAIADWLDTLDVDLTFKSPSENTIKAIDGVEVYTAPIHTPVSIDIAEWKSMGYTDKGLELKWPEQVTFKVKTNKLPSNI